MLIDESLHWRFAAELVPLQVSTVRDQGWTGLRNGVLLRAAVAAGFDVLITADRALPYQQNLERIGMAVLVLTRVHNRIDELRLLVPQILSIVPLLRPGDSFEISPLRGDVIEDRALHPVALSSGGAGFSTPAPPHTVEGGRRHAEATSHPW